MEGKHPLVNHVHCDKAPKAIAAYSHAVAVRPGATLVYSSGQLGVDPATGAFPSEDIGDQTRVLLQNLQNVLESANSSLKNLVKVTVFLTDMADYAKFNEEYAKWFPSNPPARTCVAVKGLPRNAKVEIEGVGVANF